MNDLSKIQKRYLEEENPMKLGHLASDLARIASLTNMKAGEQALLSVIEEAKFFTEWAATSSGVSIEIQIFLAEIQGFLARKELEADSNLNNEEWKKSLSHCVRTWSHELLEKAGFLDSNESN